MIHETKLLYKINKYLKNYGYLYKNEVVLLERKIDVIGIKNKTVIAIELKVKDWKKALEQAITCKLCSHYVYAAFWFKYVPNDLSSFENYGIGVMSIDGTVNIISKAKKSNIIHKSLLDIILKQMYLTQY